MVNMKAKMAALRAMRGKKKGGLLPAALPALAGMARMAAPALGSMLKSIVPTLIGSAAQIPISMGMEKMMRRKQPSEVDTMGYGIGGRKRKRKMPKELLEKFKAMAEAKKEKGGKKSVFRAPTKVQMKKMTKTERKNMMRDIAMAKKEGGKKKLNPGLRAYLDKKKAEKMAKMAKGKMCGGLASDNYQSGPLA
jgi:hypothetical protein